MWEFLQKAPAQAVIWTTAAAVMCVVAYYVLQKFRDSTAQDTPNASDHISNFRELHSQGGLSETEYRTIKSVLGEQLKDQVNDSEKTT